MPYTAEISRSNPMCILLLIDQSGSMSDPFGGSGSRRKSDGLADATNKLLQTMVLKNTQGESIYDRFFVGVIGYGATVRSAFAGALAGRDLVPISEIGKGPARLESRTQEKEDGTGGTVKVQVHVPVWVDATADGVTPMCQAFRKAGEVLSAWLREHPKCFPPIVINFTDGEATDGDITAAAESVRSLSSEDGQVLLLNAHLSSSQAAPILFPSSDGSLPDQYAKSLFRISSELTPAMREVARPEYPAIAEGARGFAFNADLVSVIKFLDIGTRTAR